MERVLALTLFVLTTMLVVTVKLLSRAGVFDSRADWTQYLAVHMSLWLIVVPFFYAIFCEAVVGRGVSVVSLGIVRSIGFGLLGLVILLLAWMIFGF